MAAIPIYIESGAKRVFAGAMRWPGWCRSGRDETKAMAALVEAAPRYAAAVGDAVKGFKVPADERALEVVERLRGDATTDFGAPSAAPSIDEEPLPAREAARQIALLEAAWAAFDAAARAADGVPLRKGPRGGGREVDAIVSHVFEAERAYLAASGGQTFKLADAPFSEENARLRATMLELLASRAKGDPPPRMPRSGKVWSPAYTVRRSAWHALDHAWEIEDRRTDG